MFLFFFSSEGRRGWKSQSLVRSSSDIGGPCAAPDTAKGPQLSDVGENPTHGGLHIRVMMEASALRKTLVLVCLVFVACFFKNNEVSWSRNNWWPGNAKGKTFHMKPAVN